ncbi:MAG TPA: hypothetical protein VKG84_04840 [Candidatus Acidoferrales bacterium]|nr:hypothetical protein [Candidatus Acidoferrales bacterium]
MKTLGEIVRDLALLAALGLCVWYFPKTILAIEGVCGLGTLALFLFERSMLA